MPRCAGERNGAARSSYSGACAAAQRSVRCNQDLPSAAVRERPAGEVRQERGGAVLGRQAVTARVCGIQRAPRQSGGAGARVRRSPEYRKACAARVVARGRQSRTGNARPNVEPRGRRSVVPRLFNPTGRQRHQREVLWGSTHAYSDTRLVAFELC